MASTSIVNKTTPTQIHPKFEVKFAPEPVTMDRVSFFLAGSIEQNKAELWQDGMIKRLSDLPVIVLNPRRPDWDPDWKQEANFRPFEEQVNWEMDCLIKCDVIPLYLQPGTYSPISLLELGMHAGSGKVIVCCPDGFWRKGNVEIVCRRYGLKLVTTKEDLITETRKAAIEYIQK